MLLSIVVPVYNVEKYLDECLESIVCQIDKNENEMEVILVDDGSLDSSGDICDHWVEKYDYIHVYHQKNGGLSIARNVGIQKSNGQYVMFVDSDDGIAPRALESIYIILQKRSPEVLAYNYSSMSKRLPGRKFKTGIFVDEEVDRFLQNAGIKYPIHGSACLYLVNKDFLVKNELWFLDGIYHEDSLWTPRVLCAVHRLEVSEENFYMDCITPDLERESITRSPKNWEKRIQDLDIVSRELNIEAKKYADDEIRQLFLYRMSAVVLQNRLILAVNAGKLQETVSEINEKKRPYPELEYLPKKMRYCVKLFGLEAGTRLYVKFWK